MKGGLVRNQTFVFSVCLGLSAAACDRSTSLRLPDPAPKAELAFGALYDGDAPSVVGEMVSPRTVYAGRYALSGAEGLTARIFFLRSAALQEKALETCASRPTAKDRLLCTEGVEACMSDPVSCWHAVKSSDGCGARMDLGTEISVEAFTNEDGRLKPLDLTTAPEISVCGPSTEPGCPNRRAGYILTEGGSFACIAEVRQIGCVATLRAPQCGLAEITVNLDAAGAPIAPAIPGCIVAQVASDSFFMDAAEFGLECGNRSFDYYAQESLLAIAQCSRGGPGIFETESPVSGRISDVLSISARGGQTRLVMNGIGFDACADFGCQRRRIESCNSDCDGACSTSHSLPPCNNDAWAKCVPISQLEACLDRCRNSCERPADDPDCYRDASGLAVTLSTPEAPELELARVNLDTDNRRAARGHPTLARIDDQWFVSVTEAQLFVHQHQEDSAEAIVQRGQFDTQMTAAGVVKYGPDALAWYGDNQGQTEVRTGQLLRAETAELTVSATPTLIANLSEANAAVMGGPTGQWLYLASLSSAETAQSESQLHIVDLSTGVVLPAVSLPGMTTAITALPQGAVLVSYRTPESRAAVAIVEASQGRASLAHTLTLPKGLRVRALTQDPRSCGPDSLKCQVLVGFESSASAAPALLGALIYDPLQPSMLRMTATLRAAASQTVSQLLVDAEQLQVWVIAGDRNQLSPFELSE